MNGLTGRAASEMLDVAQTLADSARAPLLRHYRTQGLEIDNKDETAFDPVTLADREGEEAIRRRLEELRPNDGFIGEETGTSDGTSGLTWVVDPIDGTRSYITGMPVWTVIIGLFDGSRPVVGVVDQPYLDERYWGVIADESSAAWRHGGTEQPLRTRRCGELESARISTTHGGAFASESDFTAFRQLERQCQMSRHGGDAYQYALLAEGRFDLVVESGLNVYDILGIVPIIEGAGGKITNWEGGSCAWGGRVLAAGDSDLHDRARAVLETAQEQDD